MKRLVAMFGKAGAVGVLMWLAVILTVVVFAALAMWDVLPWKVLWTVVLAWVALLFMVAVIGVYAADRKQEVDADRQAEHQGEGEGRTFGWTPGREE